MFLPPDRLRTEFHYYLEEQCVAASAENQPVLVLIFFLSHGRPSNTASLVGKSRDISTAPACCLNALPVGLDQRSTLVYKPGCGLYSCPSRSRCLPQRVTPEDEF